MNRSYTHRRLGRFAATLCASVLVLSACSSNDDNGDSSVVDNTDAVIDQDSETDANPDTNLDTDTDVIGAAGVDLSLFADGALLSSDIVDCELSDGSTGQCYELVTVGAAKSTDLIGPFCPRTTTTAAADAGVWLDGTTLYEADGDFFLNLPNIYGDEFSPADNWIFYDGEGNISVTDTLEGCVAAARPDVDPAFQSFCVECSLDDFEEDPSISFLIPVSPVPADAPGTLSASAGVSLNGFQIAAAAPVQDILSNFTIAAFDDCGGHVNPTDGYHFHSSTGREGCNSAGTEADGHPALIGFALDGYGIYGTLSDSDELNSLDECLGHEDETRGYHYHAASPELNQHIACYTGITQADVVTDGPGGGGGGPPGGAPPGG